MTAEQQGSETDAPTRKHSKDDLSSSGEREAVGTRIARLLIAERNARPAWFAFDDAARIARGVDR